MSSFIKTFYEISSDSFKLKRKKFCELDNIHLQKSYVLQFVVYDFLVSETSNGFYFTL